MVFVERLEIRKCINKKIKVTRNLTRDLGEFLIFFLCKCMYYITKLGLYLVYIFFIV